MVIATVPEVQENYYNIKRLCLEAGVDKLTRKFTIATDLKLCNIQICFQAEPCLHRTELLDSMVLIFPLKLKHSYQRSATITVKTMYAEK